MSTRHTTRISSLDAQATRLLRKNGFTWSGRPKAAVPTQEQIAFEMGMIRCPFRGASRAKRTRE